MTKKPYEHGPEQFELGRDSINARAVAAVSNWLKLSPEKSQILGERLRSLAPWLRGVRVADASADEVRKQIRQFADAAAKLEQARAGLSLEARQLLQVPLSDMLAISRAEQLAWSAARSLKSSSRGPSPARQSEIARELLALVALVREATLHDFKMGTKGAALVEEVRNGRRKKITRQDPMRSGDFRAIQFLMAVIDPTLTRLQRAGAIDDAYAEWLAVQRQSAGK